MVAGIYQELIGKTADADMYYTKAGEDAAKVIDSLFQ
jgi:hypothetical protein